MNMVCPVQFCVYGDAYYNRYLKETTHSSVVLLRVYVKRVMCFLFIDKEIFIA